MCKRHTGYHAASVPLTCQPKIRIKVLLRVDLLPIRMILTAILCPACLANKQWCGVKSRYQQTESTLTPLAQMRGQKHGSNCPHAGVLLHLFILCGCHCD